MEHTQDTLKVVVRVRPVLSREMAKEQAVFVEVNLTQGRTVKVTHDAHLVDSHYDQVFASTASQQDIFEYVSVCLAGVTHGFNATVFAYGQTGSGKTHTMFGSEWESNLYSRRSQLHSLDDPTTHGVIPRSIVEILQRVSSEPDNKRTVLCSFLQIYNERIFDLLQDSNLTKSLNVREDKTSGIFVEGLAEYVVQNIQDVMPLIKRGDKNRCVRATRMNAASSRSHTIFRISIESDTADQKGMLQRAKLNLCDLAGSEKFDKSRQMASSHLAEMNNINLSLTTLGKVVAHLSKRARGHVPYRDSKLTRLLQDSLGGNTQTVFIVTISPLTESVEESLSTLKFADRAKQVMISVKRNEVSATSEAVVVKLQREVTHLKQMLQLRKLGPGGLKEINQQLWLLKEENCKLREMSQAVSPQEVERLKQENKQMRLQLQRMFDSTMTTALSADISRSVSQASQLTSKSTVDNCELCIKGGSPCQEHLERQRSSMSRLLEFSGVSSPKQVSRLSNLTGNSMLKTHPVEVRIRTRNALVEKKMGFVGQSWAEEAHSKALEHRQRQALERLRTLERIEQQRTIKAQEQIAKLEEARQAEEEFHQQKTLEDARRMRYLAAQRRKDSHTKLPPL
jgi:hypothetical protein